MLNEKRNQFRLLAHINSAREMIETTKDHLDRNPFQRFIERRCDLHTQIAQYGVEEPGCVELNLHTIAISNPQVRQAEQSFGQQKRFFNSPPSPIEGADFARRKFFRIQDVRQIVVPSRTPQDRDSAQAMTTRIGTILPDLDDLVADVRSLRQHFNCAISSLFTPTRDEKLAGISQLIKEGEGEPTRIQPDQSDRKSTR